MNVTFKLESIINDIDEKIEALQKQRVAILKALDEIGTGDDDDQAPQPAPPKVPKTRQSVRQVTKKTLPPERRPIADESDPHPCGVGSTPLGEGSQPWVVLQAIQRNAPHWMTAVGVLEAVPALRLMKEHEVPVRFDVTINRVLKQLREGKFLVPGAEYKREGRRYFYRVNREQGDDKEGA